MLIQSRVLAQLKLHQLMILMILKLEKDKKLKSINILNEEGKINDNAPNEYIGLDRFEARQKIIEN